MHRHTTSLLSLLVAPFALTLVGSAACSGNNLGGTFEQSGGSSPQPGTGGAGGAFSTGPGSGEGGDPNFSSGSGTPASQDPKTCEEAAYAKTYIGCDFWPTVTANHVWSVFDFAAVVANTGAEPVNVKVERNGSVVESKTILPNDLGVIYLDWVTELKGKDFDICSGVTDPYEDSVVAEGGAYHLSTDRPVTVYQFNALEYKGAGGKPGKSWAECPGLDACDNPNSPNVGTTSGCFSFSNDASLLLPSTAMTGNYRVSGAKGEGLPPTLTITGTADGTQVKVKLSKTARVAAGGTIDATNVGGTVTFDLDAGDVAQLTAGPTDDFSGSLVQANHPVQVVAGVPCVIIPDKAAACDHIEESVLPAETLGRHYFVTVPTGPHGTPVGHRVKLYGNVDGTTLTYPSGKPSDAPTTLDAGEVRTLDGVAADFEVAGDKEFAVGSFQLGGSIVDPEGGKGDPSQSSAVALEQYRTKYVFLAPTDYDVNFVDVVQPMDAVVTLDGVEAPKPTPIGTSTAFGVARLSLGAGKGGAHVLTATKPVGIQVMGYGAFTSYQVPGGLNLDLIAPPPK